MPAATKSEANVLSSALTVTATALEEAKRRKEEAELAFSEAEQTYLEIAFKAKAAGLSVSGVEFVASNGIPMSATLVDGTGQNSQLDEAKLVKKIGARAWKTIVKEVIDSAKLKAQIAAGAISAVDVAACTTRGDKKSFARFTARTSSVKAVKRARPPVSVVRVSAQ